MLLDEVDNPKGIDWYDLNGHCYYLGEKLEVDDRFSRSMKMA